MENTFTIQQVPFDERAKNIRMVVFVQEQAVPIAEEFDEEDATALHWLACIQENPVGTVRLSKGRLGRLAVLKDFRGQGIGEALTRMVIEKATDKGLKELNAWVQTWAEPWYEKQGFQVYGAVFDDAGIPHRKARMDL